MVCVHVFGIAQKPTKGSSPDKPWSDDITGWHPRALHNDSLHKWKEDIAADWKVFGKWEFKSKYPFFSESNVKDARDSIKFFPWALSILPKKYAIGRWVNHTVDYTVTMALTGTTPDKNKINGRFYFEDSLFEIWNEVGFFDREQDYNSHLLKESIQGYMSGQGGDSSSFSIVLYFENKDSSLNQNSFINTGKGLIRLKPNFETDGKKIDYKRSQYRGFDFIQNDKLIGGANIRKDFLGGFVYKYWLSPELDSNTSRAVASAIFIITTYF